MEPLISNVLKIRINTLGEFISDCCNFFNESILICFVERFLHFKNFSLNCSFENGACFFFELFGEFFAFEQCLNICFDVDSFFLYEFFLSFFRFGNNFISCYFLCGNNLFFGCRCFGNYFLVFVYFYFFSRSSFSCLLYTSDDADE